MFDIGFAELILIFVLGLLILGPERLPRVATQLGRWIGRARRTATQLRRQLEREIELEELSKVTRSHPKPKPAANPPPEPSGDGAGSATTAGGEPAAGSNLPDNATTTPEPGIPTEEAPARDERP
jgi:sec-independent protein translocase protein TatB